MDKGVNKEKTESTKGAVDTSKINVDIETLFKSGAHFGHKASKWHPKMAPYIHSERRGGHVINLDKTVVQLESILPVIAERAKEGKQILFVGTKTQLKEAVKKAAMDSESPFVTERWYGGMLTNRQTMLDRVKRLKTLEAKLESGEFESRYSKLEVQRLQEERDKLNKFFGGIKDMSVLPGLVIVFDAVGDQIAIKEANRLGIDVVAVCDSNANPSGVKYLVAANDDATSTVKILAEYFKQAVVLGNNAR